MIEEQCFFHTVTPTVVASCVAQNHMAPPPVIPAECAFFLDHPGDLSNHYPASSRRLKEQGPVVVAFTLAEREGKASDTAIVAGSLSSRLDNAAIRVMQTLRFRTACPGTRYQQTLHFELGEDLKSFAIRMERAE